MPAPGPVGSRVTDGTTTTVDGSNVFDAEAFVAKPAAGNWRVRMIPQGVDHAFFRMLLNRGGRVLSPASVELMTMDHLTPAQKVEKDQFGDHFGRHGGFGFGMAVRTHRRDLASPGQFGWDGGLGTTAYADPARDMVGILLTQTAMDSADTPRLHQDFWTAAYQTIP